MNFKNLFVTALRALNRNKMRSALTSIGIIIGVSSVIMMIGIGNSARIAVREKIFTYGANAMSVYDSKKPLTLRDVENIDRLLPQIRYISPFVYKSYILTKGGGQFIYSRLYGVNNDFFKIKSWPLMNGRYFTEREIAASEKVVIIGNSVRTELFGYTNPVGEVLNVDGLPFKIVGLLTEMGQALSGRDFDNVLIVPHTTAAMKIMGKRTFDEIYVSTYSETEIDETVDKLKEYFRRTHAIPPGKINDFKIKTSKEKLQMVKYISNTLSILLAGIASISLFVGGVGIMNIMLVSVSERTREIGIRMAIGAKKRDILTQFLIESVTLSGAGGIVGMLLGLGVYYLIIFFVDWPFIFSFFSIIVAFFFSCAVGIFFGYYPARKAADLKPIEALRYE